MKPDALGHRRKGPLTAAALPTQPALLLRLLAPAMRVHKHAHSLRQEQRFASLSLSPVLFASPGSNGPMIQCAVEKPGAGGPAKPASSWNMVLSAPVESLPAEQGPWLEERATHPPWWVSILTHTHLCQSRFLFTDDRSTFDTRCILESEYIL